MWCKWANENRRYKRVMSGVLRLGVSKQRRHVFFASQLAVFRHYYQFCTSIPA